MLAREFDPADVGRIRLSKDEKLRAAVGYLWRQWQEGDWMGCIGPVRHRRPARGNLAALVALLEVTAAWMPGPCYTGPCKLYKLCNSSKQGRRYEDGDAADEFWGRP